MTGICLHCNGRVYWSGDVTEWVHERPIGEVPISITEHNAVMAATLLMGHGHGPSRVYVNLHRAEPDRMTIQR